MLFLSGLIFCLVCTLVSSELTRNIKSDKSLQISTNSGIVQGRKELSTSGVPYWVYQGIPYAKPPIGNLRFRPPVPNDPWKGILNATKERSGCVETYPDGANGLSITGDEDCLYVNIYTSRNPKSNAKRLPVLVWIYGGAFIFGNSSSKTYGIDKLIEQDMVLVTFNYRIGMFGFLSTGDLASPGNYGLKDQSLVLKWIQQNIQNFGGDKNRVTIFGQSAGAVSVLYQMISPRSTGLFHRAIASSGSPLCLWAYSKNAKDIAYDVALAADIRTKNTKDFVNQLRKMDSETLKKVSKLVTLVVLTVRERTDESSSASFGMTLSLKTNVILRIINQLLSHHKPLKYHDTRFGAVRFGMKNNEENIFGIDKTGIAFGPTIEPPHEGAVFTESSFEAFKAGRFNRVPLIMGVTSLETAIFSDFELLIRPILFRFDLSPSSLPSPNMNMKTFEERREAGIKIKEHYFQYGIMDGSTEEILNYTTDDHFVRPLTKTAQLMWKYIPLYFYIFSYSGYYGAEATKHIIANRSKVQGVAHWEDLWYIWQRPGQAPPKGTDKVVSDRVLKLWRNFMEYGNPTPKKEKLLQNLSWPPVKSSKSMSQLFINSDLSLTRNYRWEHMLFWENLYEQYGNEPYLTY